ncbi:MAG: transposase [Kiritimatiellales bacterium]|nr:transposase [Kiritimatiellales bacterium]
MDSKVICWPHAPEHRLIERGTYIVTCGTYRKQHFLNTPLKLTTVRNLLFELAEKHGWRLQAWAVMSNHYHFVASSPDDPATLKTMLSTLHTLSARDLNRLDGAPKRRVWYNYYDSRITYEKSWLARLHYVHHNPVHHGVALNAEDYPWCSAAWFAREAGSAFVKTVNSFKIDQVKVYDDFSECAGSTALSNPSAPQSKSGVEPPHSKPAHLQSKSGVQPPHSKPAHLQSKSGVEPPHSKPAHLQSKSGVQPPHSIPQKPTF